MSWLLVSLLLRANPNPPPPHEAEELFHRGRDLMREHRAEEACPLLERSHALEPGLGTLLNIADCYEQTGRLVKAYLRFNEAAGWAQRTREARREAAALARAKDLKGRLSWISLAATAPVPGLSVSVDDFAVPLGGSPAAVPVDTGAVTLTASAPGYQPWTTHLTVGNEETRSVTLPKLSALPGKELPPLATPPLVLIESSPPLVVTAPAPPPPPPATVRVGMLVASVGGALAVAGGAGLGWSLSTYNQALQPKPTVSQAQLNTLQWVYPSSWAALGLGGAGVLSGLIYDRLRYDALADGVTAAELKKRRQLRSGVVGGIGVASVGTGVVFGIEAQLADNRFHGAPTMDAKNQTQGSVQSNALAADLCLGVGAAAIAAAVILYPRDTGKWALVPAPNGAALTGTF